MPLGSNIFARLHKWAARQDENYLTESLAVVLEFLVAECPDVACRLIKALSGGRIELSSDEVATIEIRTQVDVRQGRPDLELRTPNVLVWLEVKVESALRTGQLEGYRELMTKTGYARTGLGLLTRYPEEYKPQAAQPDYEIRWFELADWFQEELAAIAASSEVARFITSQFLDFLRERNMTLTQVGKYMPEGTRALSSLLNMLKEACAACKVSATHFGRLGSPWSLARRHEVLGWSELLGS